MATLAETLPPSPDRILTPAFDELPETQQEIVGLYEEAFGLPNANVKQQDERSEQLEAINLLAEETLRDNTVVALLRHTAFTRLEAAKRSVETAGLSWGSEASHQAVAEVAAIPETRRKGGAELPGIKPVIALRALKRLGFVEVSGGKGSHIKIHNPETGKTTTITSHRGKQLPPRLLKDILGQVSISPEVFKDNL